MKITNMTELVRRAAAKVEDEPIRLARKGGTPGIDAEGHQGVWVQLDTGPVFIRKGETAKAAFERKMKYVERGGFFGPGHKETRRDYKRVWREGQGDPIMRDAMVVANLSAEYRTAQAAYAIGKVAKNVAYQEVISKRKMSKLQARLRDLGEELKSKFKGSGAYKQIVKLRDVYRRLATKYSTIRAPAKKVVGFVAEKAGVGKKERLVFPEVKGEFE